MPGNSNNDGILGHLDDRTLAMSVIFLGCLLHLISEQNTAVVVSVLSQL